VRFAVADQYYRQNTYESLQRAVALAPGEASYLSLLAEHAEGLDLDPDSDLIRAASLSPFESRYWIRLGFRSEVEGNYTKAEQYLLRAASVDRKFDPRWALMNFYFRRDDKAKFGIWTRKAFEMTHGDLTPVFRLLWHTGEDATDIQKSIPETRSTLTAYLAFLMTEHHSEATAAVALRLARFPWKPREPGTLMLWWENFHAEYPDAAIEVWNLLCEGRALEFAPLNPLAGNIVTNGDFHIALTDGGFDWRISGLEGLKIAATDDRSGLVIRMNGDEPDELVAIDQVIPAFPGYRYRIRFRYRTPDGTGMNGLRWIVTGEGPGSAPTSQSQDLTPSSEWKQGEVVVVGDPKKLLRLSLFYRRPLGVMNAKGSFELASVSSEILK
jgi:hypothetical protein